MSGGRLPHTSLPGVTPGEGTDGDMSPITQLTLSFASGFLFWLDAAQAMAAMGLLGAVCGTLARAWPQKQSTTRWAAPTILAAATVSALLILLTLDPAARHIISQRPHADAHVGLPAYFKLLSILILFTSILSFGCVLLDALKIYGRRETLALIPRVLVPLSPCILAGWLGVTLGDAEGPILTSSARGTGLLAAGPLVLLIALAALHAAWLTRVFSDKGLGRIAGLVIIILPSCIIALVCYVLFKHAAGDTDHPGKPAAHVLLGATPGDVLPTGVALLRWSLTYLTAIIVIAACGVVGIRLVPKPTSRRIVRYTPKDPTQEAAESDVSEDVAASNLATQASISAAMRPQHSKSSPVDPSLAPLFLWRGVHTLFWHAFALWLLLYPFNFTSASAGVYLAEGIQGIPNLAANILLFIPCGMAAMGWLAHRGKHRGAAAVCAVALAAGVSMVGEALQLWLPFRHSSGYDLAANILGSGLGVFIAGPRLDRWDRRRRRLISWLLDRPWSLMTAWSVLVVVAAQLAPFDLSPERSDLRQGWERAVNAGPPLRATFDWLRDLGPFSAAFSEWAWHILPTVALFACMAFLLGRAIRENFERRGDNTPPLFFVLVLGGLGALILELSQWLVRNRTMDATGAVAAFGGVVTGALIEMAIGGLIASRIQAMIQAAPTTPTATPDIAHPPPPEPALTKTGHIPGLDAIRAAACLSVFAANLHRMAHLRGEFGIFDVQRLLESGIGVAALFILSGYLLCLSFWRSPQPRPPAMVQFFLRRAARILPAYLLCLLAVVLITKHWQSSEQVTDVFLHLSLLHNFSAESFYSINQPFWTIGIQMQFYLLLPLLLALGAWLGRRKNSALILFSAITVGAYLLHRYLMTHTADPDNPAWNRSALAHLPIFMLGVIGGRFHLWLSDRAARSQPGSFLPGIIAFWASLLALLLILSTPLQDAIEIPFGRYHFPFVPALLLLVIMFTPYSGITKLLEQRAIRWLGAISYGIYLFHLPCLKAVANALERIGWDKETHWLALGIGGLLLTLPLAAASFFLIEKPIMRWADRRTGRAPASE